MIFEITADIVATDRPAARQITAQLLRILRTSPTGRKRQPTAAGKTLYKQLRSLGLSRHIIVHEITWDLMNSIRQEAYLNRLRNSKLQNVSATRALPPSTLDVFLANLMFDHPDEIDTLLNSSNKVVKSTTIEYLTEYLLPLTVLVKNSRVIDKKIATEYGVMQNHTNLPKIALNRGTACLCNGFIQWTGQPHYGLVGQLLYRAGLETFGEYSQLAARVQRRFEQWNKAHSN